MNKTNFTEEEKLLFIKSGDEKLCEHVFELSRKECEIRQITMTPVQQVALLSHLSAMVYRSITKEKLAAIDRSLFSEISQESFGIAKKVKEALEHLDEDEIYLLSIHFEIAKHNS